MKKLTLLCTVILYACVLSSQPSFQTSLVAGISLPLNSNEVNATHAGRAIHFGNHLDYSFGNGAVKVGLGAYIGYINALSTDGKYKEIGEAIAEKYRFTTSQLTFNSSSFKSTHILFGPVVSFGSGRCNINLWGKAGYGLNEPGRYAVMYKENGVVNNIYINQSGENKNGLAYNAGAGVKVAISDYVGFLLSANYFSTQTDQVNYNFDREKGMAPQYSTAANQFIQASAGLQFTIGNPVKKGKTAINHFRSDVPDTGNPSGSRMDQKIKTKSNIKNDRVINTNEDNPAAARMGQKIKTKSNIKNDRVINEGENSPEEARINKSKSNVKNNRMVNSDGNNANDNDDSDALFFSPEKIELRTQVPGQGGTPLQAVDNYLTGFVYQTRQGAVISQCGSNAMPGEPIPGIDVRLRRIGAAGNDVMQVRTNRDGSFAFNNITPGDYTAEAGNDKMNVTVNGNKENDFKVLDVNTGSCGTTKENYIINAGDKTYVEVMSAREASTGMATGKKHIANVKYNDISVNSPRDAATGLATGKRMHKPYRVTDMEFTVNMNNIVTSDGKLYAEVITAREAGSGLATGRRSTVVTGDVDGDGMTDYTVVSPRDAASGLATGKRMHKPFVITKELDVVEEADEMVSPRDAASGLATGKRMHKPFVITKELNMVEEGDEMVSPRDAASGLATGKRMHKPFVITKELDMVEEGDERVSPRDAASGLATGKRMHKPFVVTIELNDNNEIVSPRDAASGLPTGKRMHKPYVITINPDEDNYEIISPRDAASGLPTGKRMHKPFVITKELDMTEDGDEVITYKIIHRDLAARNLLMDEESEPPKMAISEQGLPKKKGQKKGIITGKDNDNGMYTETDVSYEGVVNNPLYENSGAQGVNPLFEAKDNLRVIGSNGVEHSIFIPSNIIIQQGGQPAITPFSEYAVVPVKWMAPESMTDKKGITQSGIKKNDAVARKGWDGTIKGNSKNINTSEAGVGTGKAGIDDAIDNTAARKGWDGTVKGGAIVTEISRVHCADGTCAIDAIVTVDGKEYEALITGTLKTKHDTVKNSINNVR
jgi:hypothetical protein